MGINKDNFKLLVIDLDGTALGGHTPYEQFPWEFVIFLRELNEIGIKWATNTTWGLKKQLALLRASKIQNAPAFLSGASGREIGCIRNGRLLKKENYSTIIARYERAMLKKYKRHLRQLSVSVPSPFSQLDTNCWGHQCITYQARDEQMTDAVKLLTPLLKKDGWYLNDPDSLSQNCLLPHFMTKAFSLDWIKKQLKLQPEEIIVAGNDINDLPMFNLALAKYWICPSNADRRVKDWIGKHNGVIAQKPYSWGIIEGVKQLLV